MTTTHELPASVCDFSINQITDLADRAGSTLIEIAAPGIVGIPKSVPALLNRKDGIVNSVRSILDGYRTAPEAKTGTAKVLTLESFIELINYHAVDTSTVFANTDWKKPSLLAVIDYHQATDAELRSTPGTAKFGRHRISYDFPFSEEWKAWSGQHGKPMGQNDFAEFIEDHISDVCEAFESEKFEFEPLFSARMASPNELITLSRGLQVFTDTNVKQSIRLQSGESQLIFDEAHRDSAGNKLDVPGMFMLSLPAFFSGENVRLPVRLRYRVRDGRISWEMLLYRPDKVITDAVKQDLETVEKDTKLPCFEGSPEV